MFKLFKDCFKITNDCIILAAPLIVLASIFGWYLSYTIESANTLPRLLLGSVTILVIGSAFLSVWLYMVKKVIPLASKIFVFDRDRVRALIDLVNAIPQGAAKLFAPLLVVNTTYFLTYGISIVGLSTLLSKHFGIINLENLNLGFSLISSAELFNELKELPLNDLKEIGVFVLLFVFVSVIISLVTLLWIPEIVYREKLPFRALRKSIDNLISNWSDIRVLFAYLAVLLFVLVILISLLMINLFLYFLVLILFYYFIVYVVVLLFSYYEQNVNN
jgi:hypothetical protein